MNYEYSLMLYKDNMQLKKTTKMMYNNATILFFVYKLSNNVIHIYVFIIIIFSFSFYLNKNNM